MHGFMRYRKKQKRQGESIREEKKKKEDIVLCETTYTTQQ